LLCASHHTPFNLSPPAHAITAKQASKQATNESCKQASQSMQASKRHSHASKRHIQKEKRIQRQETKKIAVCIFKVFPVFDFSLF